MKNKKALIVIPTYNEREGITNLIPEIFDVVKDIKGWDVEILIVDDKSPDGTADQVRIFQKKYKDKLHLILGDKGGLGVAYVRGFRHAVKEHDPYVIFEMDGDGQHTPKLIPAFLKKIEEGYDFVIGSRYIEGGSIPSHWGIDRKFYSIIGSIVAQIGFMNFRAKDWTSGYRCIKASYIANIVDELEGYNGYEFQIANLDKAFKNHLRVGEVPLNFTDRLDGESKFSSIDFIFNALLYILLNSTFIKYALVGLSGAVIDFGFAYIFVEFMNVYKPTANAFSAELAIIYNYLLNNFWAFNHRKISGKGNHLTKFLSFNLVSSGSIIIQWVGMFAALNILGDFTFNVFGLGIGSWLVYKFFIIALLVIPYSYFMYNTFIWKDPSKTKK